MTTKTLKDLFTSYRPKAKGEQDFVDKHTGELEDNNDPKLGPKEDQFKADKVKTVSRKNTNHGYDSGDDAKVYEEVEELDELSTPTLRKYREKARDDAFDAHDVDDDRRLRKRSFGANQAGKKILKRGDSLRAEENDIEGEQIDELSRATVGRYSMKAKSIADNEGGKDRTKGRELAGRKKWGGTMSGVEKAKVPATEEVETDVEAEQIDELSRKTLGSYGSKALRAGLKGDEKSEKRFKGANLASAKLYPDQYQKSPLKAKVNASEDFELDEGDILAEGKMSLSKVHIVHHHDEPAAKEFAKHYTAGMKGDHREGGPTEKDEKASNDFHTRYGYTHTRHGFAGSGTTVYHDRKTGAHWKVDRHPNGKTFYGTDHYISPTTKVHEDVETPEGVEQIDELSTSTLQSYRKKARAQGNAIVDKMKMGGGDWSKDQKDTKTLRKRAAGAQASGKQLVKRGESLKTEEVEQIDEAKPRSAHYLGTVSRDDPDYDKKVSDLKKQASGGSRVRGRLGKNNPNAHLYATGGPLKRGTSQDIKPEHSSRVDVYSRKSKSTNEEVEHIDELSKATLGSYIKKAKTQMSRSDTVAGRLAGERMKGGKPSAQERKHSDRANKRYFGIDKAVDRLTKEEVINRAIEKYAPVEVPSLEERLVSRLEGLSEKNIALLVGLFNNLSEDNQLRMVITADSIEGINELLDFAINNRG